MTRRRSLKGEIYYFERMINKEDIIQYKPMLYSTTCQIILRKSQKRFQRYLKAINVHLKRDGGGRRKLKREKERPMSNSKNVEIIRNLKVEKSMTLSKLSGK